MSMAELVRRKLLIGMVHLPLLPGSPRSEQSLERSSRSRLLRRMLRYAPSRSRRWQLAG